MELFSLLDTGGEVRLKLHVVRGETCLGLLVTCRESWISPSSCKAIYRSVAVPGCAC